MRIKSSLIAVCAATGLLFSTVAADFTADTKNDKVISASSAESSRLRIEGDTHRTRKKGKRVSSGRSVTCPVTGKSYGSSSSSREKGADHVSFSCEIENYHDATVKDLILECYIIGETKKGRKRVYYVAAQKTLKGVELERRGSLEFDELEAVFNREDGYKFEGFLVILKDEKGNILRTDTKDSFLKDIADKVSDYADQSEPSTKKSRKKHKQTVVFFDSDGEQV